MEERKLQMLLNANPNEILKALEQYRDSDSPSPPSLKVEYLGLSLRSRYPKVGSTARVAFQIRGLHDEGESVALQIHVDSPTGEEDRAIRLAQADLLHRLATLASHLIADLKSDSQLS